MAGFENLAAWSLAPQANLTVDQAPLFQPENDEILIKNEAVALQPLDARIRRDAYVKVAYPFILGNTIAGTIVATGPDAGDFKVGDRVVSDASLARENKSGGWQRFVIRRAGWTAKIGDAPFDQAVTVPWALLTAVGALHVHLSMELPNLDQPVVAKDEKVLIWGAGGAVGGYAVQFARSVGYTVVATASPRAWPHLQSLGVSHTLDYKSDTIVEDLRALGPFKFLLTASGDAASQQAIASLLQPDGGKFASVIPGNVQLPANVEKIYDFFGTVTMKDTPAMKEFAKWWYGEYLGRVIRDKLVEPTQVDKKDGGLAGIQSALDSVLEGKIRGKAVFNPQD